MAVKYTEVTLAQRYREVEQGGSKLLGTVSGGPMYYIEHGLGPKWKWMALFFAGMLGFTAFLTGNAVQANTVADTMQTTFGVPPWITGLVTSVIVAAVVLGGIRRIGQVTSILAPVMAGIYVAGRPVHHRDQPRASCCPRSALILRRPSTRPPAWPAPGSAPSS